MKLAKRFQRMDALYSAPQLSMESRIGFKLWPSSVSEYSTLGGTSAYTLRSISPLSSISRSCAVSTFCDTLPMDFFSSPKRFVPGADRRSDRKRI